MQILQEIIPSNPYAHTFQGQEKDDEIKGDGNSISYEYRTHDPRVGRFFAIDPLTIQYPFYTPYSFSGNKVIAYRELEGLEEEFSCPAPSDNSPKPKVHQSKDIIKKIEVTKVKSQPAQVNFNQGRRGSGYSKNIRTKGPVQIQFRTQTNPDQLIVTGTNVTGLNTGFISTGNALLPFTVTGYGDINIQVVPGPTIPGPNGFGPTVYNGTYQEMTQKIVTITKYKLFGILTIKRNRKVEYRDLTQNGVLPTGTTRNDKGYNVYHRKSRRREAEMFHRTTERNKKEGATTG